MINFTLLKDGKILPCKTERLRKEYVVIHRTTEEAVIVTLVPKRLIEGGRNEKS